MKKASYDRAEHLVILDSTDYKEIPQNHKNIDDKYINMFYQKFNKYEKLEEGSVLIKGLYYIDFTDDDIAIYFNGFKYYHYFLSSSRLDKIKFILDTKNSVLDFNMKKNDIIKIFTYECKRG